MTIGVALFKFIIVVLIIINIIFLVKYFLKKRLTNTLINIVILIVLVILFFVPNYIVKLPVLAKEVHKVSSINKEYPQCEHKHRKRIIIATEGTYYPWNYVLANGSPSGFDIEIAKEIARRLNRKPHIIIAPFQTLITNLNNKQYDIVVAALSITPERKRAITFSHPYAGVHITFFGNREEYLKYKKADLNTLKEVLKGKTVGTQVGTTWPFFLNEEFKDIVKIKYYNTQPQLMMEVSSGRVDVGFAEIPSVRKFIDDHPEITMFGPSIGIKESKVLGEGIAVGVALGDDDLLEKVNQAIEGMHEDGTIKALSLKYFDLDISYKGK